MKNILVMGLVASLLLATLGTSHAFASTWKSNPLDKLDVDKKTNTSEHVSEKKKLSPKSYSYKTSKVCGLSFCDGKEQKPALQNVWSHGLSTQWVKDFDGKSTIKGYFLRN